MLSKYVCQVAKPHYNIYEIAVEAESKDDAKRMVEGMVEDNPSVLNEETWIDHTTGDLKFLSVLIEKEG